MLAAIAAVLLGLHAIGVDPGEVNLGELGLAFWAAHFAWAWSPFARRGGDAG
jgi:hypothetical protein